MVDSHSPTPHNPYAAAESFCRTATPIPSRPSQEGGLNGYYDWALVPLVHLTATTGSHALLVRRSLDNPTDLALFLVFTPRAATLAEIVRAAGQRWQIETGFEAAKQEVGLGHYEVRQWEAWYRHITLALLAYAFLAVVRTRAGPAGKKTGSP